MSEESSPNGTITISKSSLWKYSTFILAAILIVGAFVFFGRGTGNGTGNAVNNGGNDGAIDLSVFTDNPNLYPALGPSNAAVTVIELADFQCPYCALTSGQANWASQYSQYADLIGSAGKVEQLAEQGKIRFIFVPLSFLGQESVNAAQAVLCANEQGKFWEMHDAVYQASDGPSENTGKYNKDKLETIAQGVSGLDQAKFKSCLENDADLSKVNKVMSDTQSTGIQIATPQFFVNGQQVSAGWSSISAALQDAGISVN